MTGERVRIERTTVSGVDIDAETRCRHYDGARDVVAIALPCCGTFYACYRCHDAQADHGRERWPTAARAARAVLCGACGARFGMWRYLERLKDEPSCPTCGSAFNPGCLDHRGRYVVG